VSIEKLIADAAGRIDADTAAALLHRGLTLEGRVEREAALAALSPAERHACDRVTAQERSPSLCTGSLSLAFRPHGRLYLLPREEFEAHAEALTLLCHVELDGDDLQTYHALRRSAQQALEQERAEICADLNEQGFERVCTELASVAEHMAPLICYVGERCISNFYNVGKSGFAPEMTLADTLQQVAERREQADIEVLTAVHCLHLVLRSGSYTRLEELNASQLSRRAVLEFFDAKRAFYEQTCGCPAEERFATAPLREKAALLARMRETIATRQRFIRLINGTNLRKREAVLPLPPASAHDVLAPIIPSANVLTTLQRCLPPGSSVQRLFSPEHFEHLLGTALLPEEQLSSFDSCLEYLLDRVVAEAVRSTNSDIGMSRSARDYRRFAEVLRARQTAVASGWSQAEYFCHVVASPAVLKTLSPKAVCMTLNAISARMRFNSWHYAPSYFDVADIPAGRGWFTAPRMADIADDSDQHHSGHIHAVVRYSIRSPLPLRVGHDVLPGFIDLRLMRQSRDPYGQEELVTAIAYTEVLQFLYQHLMNHVLERNVGFVFSFGDKKWFDRMYPVSAAPMPQAAPVAQAVPLPQQAPPAPQALHV
jgi:hypothetical protein